MKTVKIFLFSIILISCNSLKNQEVKQLEDVKEILQVFLDNSYESNSKRKTKEKKDFIYFQIQPIPDFKDFSLNKTKLINKTKDSTLLDVFFGPKAIQYYKTQTIPIEIENLEKTFISSKFKSIRPKLEVGNSHLQLFDRHIYSVTLPIFTEDRDFALVLGSSKLVDYIIIYRKEKNKWIFYEFFLLNARLAFYESIVKTNLV